MMNKDLYTHKLHITCEERLKSNLKFEKEAIAYYQEFDEKLKQADLLGKTLLVSEKQFAKVNRISSHICQLIDLKKPNIYVYEDFYYGCEAKGSDEPWIEISAKTVTDFSEKELCFLIARELCRINNGSVYLDVWSDQLINLCQNTDVIPGNDVMAKTLKLIYSQWSRVSHLSADNFGYLMADDLKSCILCVLKLILNNVALANEINLSEYLNQAAQINRLDDAVARYTKNDEKIPYGPMRIKNLIAFASSEAVINHKMGGKPC